MRHTYAVSIICLVSVGIFAQSVSPAATGAQLDIQRTCTLAKSWSDKGSGADLDGFFYLPVVDASAYIIGGYGTREKTLTAEDCMLAVGASAQLVEPIAWELIWLDKGSGARLDGSMWRAIPPSEDYRCIGTVPQIDYEKPNLPHYRCVPVAFTEKVVTSTVIWTDVGSGAKRPVSILKLPNSGSFVAVPGRTAQIEVVDLRLTPVVPDTATADHVVPPAESAPAEVERQVVQTEQPVEVPVSVVEEKAESPKAETESEQVAVQPVTDAEESSINEGSVAIDSAGSTESVQPPVAQASAPQLANTPGLPTGVSSGELCAVIQDGRACWMELENQPGCFIWKPYSGVGESAKWSGACADGLADGTGTITLVYSSDQGYSFTATGKIQQGKLHGQWSMRHDDGIVREGPFMDGEQHGHWVARNPDSSVYEGPMVDGKAHGRWVVRNPDGSEFEMIYENDAVVKVIFEGGEVVTTE